MNSSTYIVGGALVVALAAAGLLFLTGGHQAGAGEAFIEAYQQGDQAMDEGASGKVVPRYSRSGYDITPLTREQIDAILPTLTPEQVRVTQDGATEAPFCGLYNDMHEDGIYVSVIGGLPLFRSTAKFVSKSGWASFFEPFDRDHIIERPDNSHGMHRIEILDARSGAHLGHVFDDGPPPTGKRYCLNSAALKFIPAGQALPSESRPVEPRVAYFAGGCFWGIEDHFAKIPGVMDAVSGYMGGNVPSPSYQDVCSGRTGHAETVKVVYDPNRVDYTTLLGAFFAMHNPTTMNRQGPDVGAQYRSAIFTADDEQDRRARQYIRDLQNSGRFGDREIVTIVEPADEFYPAEAYHQDYYLRHGGSCPVG
jgi:peptide methionine sulfoxide reductase msrA/msrB